MHRWLKACCALMPPLAVRLIHSPATLIVTIMLLGSTTFSQSGSGSPGMSANELARKVVTNELKFQNEDLGHWMYRLEKEESGRKQVQIVVETKDGSLSRLLSIDGRPLNAKQQLKENQRIQKLVSNPSEQRKLQQASSKKSEQGERLFKILADVFLFDYASREGDLVQLTFRPSPTFQPPSMEARVFQHMQGEMTVDTKQERLAAIKGHLVEDVKIGGGLLGRLDKGGRFEVRQTEVVPGQWEMTVLCVDLKGKALLFKTINVQETENHSDFHRVADDLTLVEAASILDGQTTVADNR
jgi:hypothetical protein